MVYYGILWYTAIKEMMEEKYMIINKKKYKLLNDALNGLVNNIFNLLILHGTAGVGKSYNVTRYLDENKIDYTLIDSYTTPLRFYQLLYENKDKKVIVFDDLEGIADNKIRSMLKSACWNIYKDRNVSYFSTSSRLDNIPNSFEIKANIILICNKIPKGFEPVVNRGEQIDFFFSHKEKIEIFEEIHKHDPIKIDKEVLDYVRATCNDGTKNLSIRTMEILSSYKKAGSEWRLHAEEMLKTDERIQLVIQAVKGNLTNEEWTEKTGLTARTLQRYKQNMRDGGLVV